MESIPLPPAKIYHNAISVKEVEATMNMEGFNLDRNELQLLSDCLTGARRSDVIRREVIARFTGKMKNA